jgi:hypothetical protein
MSFGQLPQFEVLVAQRQGERRLQNSVGVENVLVLAEPLLIQRGREHYFLAAKSMKSGGT